MPTQRWSRQQLLVAFALYCRIPFGKFHQHNPELIHYAKLLGRTTSALAMKLSNIASLDPVFTASGRSGLAGASKSDKMMWEEMQGNWEKFVSEAEEALNNLGQSFETKTELDIDQDYRGKDKISTVKIRVGQVFFRNAVLSAYDYKCCITGLAIPELLVASHIKPWSKDESNRLNPRNGLALSALHDKAFDLGIITVDEKMRVCVSRKVADTADSFFQNGLLAFEGRKIADAGKFSPDLVFLDYHRANIFEKIGPFRVKEPS